ncbi:hypothetical protein GCM10009639_24100 [Kitasatospora putterlickiae]|uniref:SIS domain-containing protein n=1 Tax=Kitasatospora putterlickiae TaxID=221725 RepID=A0ABN1XZV0_9ACTN
MENADRPATEEVRPEWTGLDRLGTLELLRLLNAEDRAVTDAVAGQLPRIAVVVDAVAGRMTRGGRLVYAGAGTAGRLGVLDAGECPPTFNTAPGQVVGVIAGGPGALVRAVEGAEDRPGLAAADLAALALTAEDTVVGVSASGRTRTRWRPCATLAPPGPWASDWRGPPGHRWSRPPSWGSRW